MALTKHPEGSMRELWHVSFPLMLSSFSVMLMVFVDRIFLARYSMDAMNAAVNSSTLGWAFIAGFMTLGVISEVFVAQYNGARQPYKIGEPVWQMVWAGVFSIAAFYVLAEWGRFWFYGNDSQFQLERDYFRWMMYFGPAFTIFGALTGFFVGRGKTKIITALAFGANFVNGILDYILIFGVEGVVPSMGVKGAAIATSFSGLFQMVVLFVIFLTPKNRREFNTGVWQFKWHPFYRCLRIGLPGAVFILVEILGWGAYYMIMTHAGKDYITIAGIAQSIVILFFFVAEGVGKAATTLAGNFIGAKVHWNIHKLIKAGIGIHFIFFICLGAIFAFSSDLMIRQFLPEESSAFIHSIYEPLVVSIFCMTFYLFFEGIRFLFSGILTAAGDTLFLFIAGSAFMWIFLVFPVYLAISVMGYGIITASFICVFYSAGASFIYYLRFQHGGWKENRVIEAQ